MELSLENLTKKFDNKTAVNDLSLTLSPGVYGLLGANGAGKTTLMRMICGVLNTTSGEIRINGRDVQRNGEKYRSLLGYMPQDFGYYPDFTAKEFMYYIAALKGIPQREAKVRTKNLFHTVSLSDVANRKIRTFSGGMKQRLGIAQAVINNPKILVLDEPTAGLDPKERVRFRNLISDLAMDKIVILSTHIVPDVEHIADTILIMKNGSLLLQGTAHDITKSIEGKVWKCTEKEDMAEYINSKYCVANIHHIGNGEVELRIICDHKPCKNALCIVPTLEDLYLYHFQNNEGEGIIS